MTIYSFVSPKGGVGKTTSAAEAVLVLTSAGRKVLAIDFEPQGNFAARLGITLDTLVESVTDDVLRGNATLTEAAVPAPAVTGADVVIGTRDLAAWDADPETVHLLADELARLGDAYDDVVIDTPPSLHNLVRAALVAADVVVALVQCATEAFEAVADDLVPFVEQRVAARLRPGQRVHWFVPTMAFLQTSSTKDVLEMLEVDYPGRVTVPIRHTTDVKDGYTSGLPVGLYRPNSTAAQDYAVALATVLAPSLTAVTTR
ncbi:MULTISPECIES: ParA family protein [Pimelobacter]|uniref:ParA family protein n=1 Tax=Pimelobacter TaxID=2044 RepID=UPI001C053C62|nr:MULTISPECIES: ParA family protein [Pimelobacter]MBU2698864.1 hypothetical protein [Pimelobacter sp. 30-1]UUW92996.1 ParA family protein [Pimelobacter simplex]UUW99029.1 ParA family protein [Pimelobacter simplex]